jgi:hypothetical protein
MGINRINKWNTKRKYKKRLGNENKWFNNYLIKRNRGCRTTIQINFRNSVKLIRHFRYRKTIKGSEWHKVWTEY